MKFLSLKSLAAHAASACFALVSMASVCQGADSAESLSTETVANRFREGVALLNQQYWSPTLGIWLDRPGNDVRAHYEGRLNPPWWPSANAVEVLLDFMKVANCSDYAETVESLYELNRDYRNKTVRIAEELRRRMQWSERDERRFQRSQRNPYRPPEGEVEYYTEFRNEYLDDSGWWGITWLKMYDRSRDARHLTTARAIHAHMARNWRPDKGGGIMWSEDEDKLRPNAITNSLFLILSARLYQRTSEQPYLTWAEKTLEWFRTNNLYDGIAVVDAPGHKDDYWSYNQGTFIGGLTALYQATGKAEYLDEAVKVTGTVLKQSGLCRPDFVVIEKLGTSGDASLFKGIFVRYLAQLRDVLNAKKLHPEAAKEIDQCIRSSVTSLLQHCGKPGELFSCQWHAGEENGARDFNTQVAALAAMAAVLPDREP